MNNKDFKIATEIANAGTALVRNIAINKATEIILQRNFALNYSSTQATNEQNAIIEGNENNALNLFGLPLFDTVTFSYPATKQSYTFNIALLEVQQTKNIVTTAVQGRDGTVKEYISDGDNIVSLKASIAGNGSDVYPFEDITAINSICAIKDAIEVTSTILNECFQIYNLVITNFNVSQSNTGMRNVQSVTISGLSDNPIQFAIQQQN